MDLMILSESTAALFAEHGLVGWTFGLAAPKRRLGVCKYRRKRIEVSEFYARHNPDAAVLETLRHEIANALVGPEDPLAATVSALRVDAATGVLPPLPSDATSVG